MSKQRQQKGPKGRSNRSWNWDWKTGIGTGIRVQSSHDTYKITTHTHTQTLPHTHTLACICKVRVSFIFYSHLVLCFSPRQLEEKQNKFVECGRLASLHLGWVGRSSPVRSALVRSGPVWSGLV